MRRDTRDGFEIANRPSSSPDEVNMVGHGLQLGEEREHVRTCTCLRQPYQLHVCT